jgi:hypothetical protein
MCLFPVNAYNVHAFLLYCGMVLRELQVASDRQQ